MVKVHFDREFQVRLNISDNSGVAATKVWLGEPGLDEGAPGASRAPTCAVDPLAAAIAYANRGSGAQSLDSATATALAKGNLDIVGMDMSTLKQGLPQDTWIDLDVSKKLRLDFTKLSTARKIINGDLFDMFGAYTMYIEASDVAGNIGDGEVNFTSAMELVLN